MGSYSRNETEWAGISEEAESSPTGTRPWLVSIVVRHDAAVAAGMLDGMGTLTGCSMPRSGARRGQTMPIRRLPGTNLVDIDPGPGWEIRPQGDPLTGTLLGEIGGRRGRGCPPIAIYCC